jgi:hypothetical protein
MVFSFCQFPILRRMIMQSPFAFITPDRHVNRASIKEKTAEIAHALSGSPADLRGTWHTTRDGFSVDDFDTVQAVCAFNALKLMSRRIVSKSIGSHEKALACRWAFGGEPCNFAFEIDGEPSKIRFTFAQACAVIGVETYLIIQGVERMIERCTPQTTGDLFS